MADFLTIDEAAAHVRVSPKTIQRAMRDRRNPLRHYRPGRRVVIARVDLEQWLKAHVAMPQPSPTLLGAVSPAAKGILVELFGNPCATNAGKTLPHNGRPQDFVSAAATAPGVVRD